MGVDEAWHSGRDRTFQILVHSQFVESKCLFVVQGLNFVLVRDRESKLLSAWRRCHGLDAMA